MQDAVQRIPVTVKHRIGLDKDESYGFVRDLVGTVAETGCRHFIVHARNTWLKGLSPQENRSIPPLRYEVAYRLKQDFPNLHITLNGGIATAEDMVRHWQHVDAVMIGRAAWHTPLEPGAVGCPDGCTPRKYPPCRRSRKFYIFYRLLA